MASNKETFYRIDFVNWSQDFNYTIVRTLNDVMAYLEICKEGFDAVPEKGDAPTSATVTGVQMSERQYQNWIKKYEE